MDIKENKIEFIALKINLSHNNCMSDLGPKLNDIKLFLTTSIALKSNKYLFTIEDYYPINTNKKVSLIISNLKKNPSIVSVENSFLEGRILRISFLEHSIDSPYGLLNSLGVIKYKEISQNGIDYISFLLLEEYNIKQIMDILSSIGKITNLEKHKIDEGSFNFRYILTDQEKATMQIALSCGFFDNPKKCHIKDIAKELDISIVAADKYLRDAEKKIMIGSNEYYFHNL